MNAGRAIDVRNRRNIRTRDVQPIDSPELFPGGSVRELPFLAHRGHYQHVGRLGVELKVVANPFQQDTRSKRSESLAELDFQVHLRLHPGAAWISENASRAERSWPELHPSIEPAHNLFCCQELCNLPEELRAFQPPVTGPF